MAARVPLRNSLCKGTGTVNCSCRLQLFLHHHIAAALPETDKPVLLEYPANLFTRKD